VGNQGMGRDSCGFREEVRIKNLILNIQDEIFYYTFRILTTKNPSVSSLGSIRTDFASISG
jgi:hypothetical protein